MEMKPRNTLAALAIYVATAGLCLPQPLLAARPTSQGPTIADVALLDGEVLLGQVVDTSGVPKASVLVAISMGDQPLAVGKTDERGFFAFRGLRGGVYQLAAAQGCGAYRAWSRGTAPPTARPSVLLVSGQDLVRGNPLADAVGWGGFFFSSNPLLTGSLVATAVAIPVLIHATDQGAPASPD
jgi:hypothetical protein